MVRQCNHCHKQAEKLKMCASCSAAWYCNSDCQKQDWPAHIIRCNPGRPITTADRLVAGIHSDLCPFDAATLVDYGFLQNLTPERSEMMLEVYRVLVIDLQVKAKTIDRWMEAGILDKMMRETFDTRLSLEQRQRHPAYLWFRMNQSTFNRHTGPFTGGGLVEMSLKAKRRAWAYMGHPSDSDSTRDAAVEELPEDHLACFDFFTKLYGGMKPSPGLTKDAHHPWIQFGFCGCAGPDGEGDLRLQYELLLERVSYDAFYQAYVSSALPKLFAEKGLAIENRFILDVLSSRNIKSVWFLKEFACSEEYIARKNPAAPFIGVDYGFSNCQNVDEVIALWNAYKQVLLRSDADPLALHEACFRGELFEYVGRLTRLKPAQLFQRLMKNPYPL